jgi:hypothetical protein
MARTIKIIITAFILFALAALSTLSSSAYAEEKPPVYVGLGRLVLPPDVLTKVFNKTRLPPDTPDLSIYREFAKRFYKTCNISVDMVALLIYGIKTHYAVPGQWPYEVEYALLYDPLTGNFMWGFLNDSDVVTYFFPDDPYYSYYPLSKNFPPAGFYFWYIKVDEYAWKYNRSLVISEWYTRWNSTHIAYMANTYIRKPVYCPISDNFTWSMLFKGLPQTATMTYTMPVTITLPVTVTETTTATTTLPITIASVVTTTTPITIEKTATVASASPTTIKETVTHVETLTIERTATVSYTLTVSVTTTATIEKPITIERQATTQVVKEIDVASLAIVAGTAIAIGVAIGMMLRRR